MKIVVVMASDVLHFPPVISLVNVLNSLKVQTTLITTRTSIDVSMMENVNHEMIDLDYESITSPIKKLVLLRTLGKRIWALIDKNYDNDTIIWIVSNVTLKYLGNRTKKYRYILHLLELSEELRFYEKIPFWKLNAHQIAENAKAVVVPEYNRAHITQAWWGLTCTPLLFSNKPYLNYDISKDSMVSDEIAKKIIDEIGDRKIILYQGIISKERPLDKIINAVGMLGNKYAFVVMSGGEDIYANLGIENYYFIPFVKPPYHLEITSKAYIGILSYFPSKSTGYSVLNSLYCAPNKTYEFGAFGIPMIGNNNPGLKFLFETQKCGVCIEDFNEEKICEAIHKIEENYQEYSTASALFFSKTNSKNEVCNILNFIEKETRK